MNSIRNRCSECHSVYEIRRIKDTVEAPIDYCAFCGAPGVRTGESDHDYWMSIALDIGLPESEKSKTIVRQMFENWAPEEGDPIRFIDYARDIMTSAQS